MTKNAAKKFLTMEELHEGVCALAKSQGFYAKIQEVFEERWDELAPNLENRYESIVEFIIDLES